MKYYVYAYLREDGTPYYIGSGTGNRINQKTFHQPIVPPVERRQMLWQNLTWEEADKIERDYIEYYGRAVDGGILANGTRKSGAGMAGRKHSEETKAKMRAAHAASPRVRNARKISK